MLASDCYTQSIISITEIYNISSLQKHIKKDVFFAMILIVRYHIGKWEIILKCIIPILENIILVVNIKSVIYNTYGPFLLLIKKNNSMKSIDHQVFECI